MLRPQIVWIYSILPPRLTIVQYTSFGDLFCMFVHFFFFFLSVYTCLCCWIFYLRFLLQLFRFGMNYSVNMLLVYHVIENLFATTGNWHSIFWTISDFDININSSPLIVSTEASVDTGMDLTWVRHRRSVCRDFFVTPLAPSVF